MTAAEPAEQPRTHVAVAVVEQDGRFLIGRRAADAPLGGYWEFPGGKVRPGEAPREAAVRECLEETGLLVHVLADYPSVDYDYPHGRVRLHFFACRRVAEQRALPEPFRWVGAAELGRHAFPPANAALVARLTAGKTA